MADSLDTQVPGWLQRNWSPRETFDPTPWLQERYNRQITAQKLPLQLQGMALQNQAQQLAIEHQGIVNDEFKDELAKEAEDQPVFQQHSIAATNLPGGTIEMGTPPFKSKKYNDIWKQKQSEDANTRYNQAMHQALVTQTKQASEVMDELGTIVPRNPDGSFDEQKLAELSTKANLQRAAREQAGKIALAETRQEHYYDANGNLVSRSGSTPAPVANFEFRQKTIQDIRDAEDMGDYQKADDLREGLRVMDSAHPDLRQKARYQYLNSALREADKQLGDITLKSKWPEIEKRKSRLKQQLDDSSSQETSNQSKNSTPKKRLLWTPTGMKQLP